MHDDIEKCPAPENLDVPTRMYLCADSVYACLLAGLIQNRCGIRGDSKTIKSRWFHCKLVFNVTLGLDEYRVVKKSHTQGLRFLILS